jgi:hypothetical protein
VEFYRNSSRRVATAYRRAALRRIYGAATCLMLAIAVGCRPLRPVEQSTLTALIDRVAFPDDRNDRRHAWEAWGREHLCDGDILFIRGESRLLLGLVNFSEFSAEVAHSEFSHVGVVAVEEGEPVVYDITSDGTLRCPFGQYVTDRRVWSVAVKRLQPAYRQYVPAAVEFCRQAFRERRQFDNFFQSENERYYCSELVEAAFRHAGRPLSEPVRIESLPGFERLSPATVLLIEATTSVSRTQEVYLPGNEDFGIWASPCLTTVLEKTDARLPPRGRIEQEATEEKEK